MSEENIGPVQRHVEAWNRCDLKTWLATFHPDAEIDWSRARALYKGVYRGHAEIKVFWDEFWSTFEDIQLDVHDVTEVGSEVVIANTAHMRGRQGIEVVARSALVFTVENGRITRERLFQERDEALEAAGLAGYAMSFARSRGAMRTRTRVRSLTISVDSGGFRELAPGLGSG